MNAEHILLSLFLPQTKGECLAHFRNILTLTQSEFANELDISRSSISKMEHGDMTVSENVWECIVRKVHKAYGFDEKVEFRTFKQTLELFIKEDEKRSNGGWNSWRDKKLSLQPVTSI